MLFAALLTANGRLAECMISLFAFSNTGSLLSTIISYHLLLMSAAVTCFTVWSLRLRRLIILSPNDRYVQKTLVFIMYTMCVYSDFWIWKWLEWFVKDARRKDRSPEFTVYFDGERMLRSVWFVWFESLIICQWACSSIKWSFQNVVKKMSTAPHACLPLVPFHVFQLCSI